MDTRSRSLIKTISWRLIATILTLLVSYAWLHEWETSLALALVANVLKAGVYYLHERVWNVVRWGKAAASRHADRAGLSPSGRWSSKELTTTPTPKG